MRILHTSDWHLGKTLSGFSRAAEHEAFLEEIVDLADDVDVVLVSGDVFDTYNPPIEAEELLYDALARLGDGGRRAVVVIAGNHDSPDRLAAPAPLSARHGVFILGRPGDNCRGRTGPGVSCTQLQPGVLGVQLPRGEEAVIAALPYPSEARLGTTISCSLHESDMAAGYAEKLRSVFADMAEHFRPGAVNLLTSHLQVRDCTIGDSERTLVGGAYQVPATIFPAGAQYAALGHLHRPQEVPGAPCMTRYAGSPLAFRMSEAAHDRSHCIVDVQPGCAPRWSSCPSTRVAPWSSGTPREASTRC